MRSYALAFSALILCFVAFLPGRTVESSSDDGQDGRLHLCDPEGTQDSGALYRLCVPPAWNGTLVLYAHGYVAPTEPLAVQTQVGSTDIADVFNLLGYGFATTSYSKSGLAVRPAIEDLLDLVNIFIREKGQPDKVYLFGASQGGLVVAKSLELWPQIYDGGVALCGPYGDFQRQLDYFADVRVLFDYFFPGLLPGTADAIPQSLIDDWQNHYDSIIKPALVDPANAEKVDQLLAVAGIPTDTGNPATAEEAIQSVLWYNVFATNDGVQTLGGQPYENRSRVYSGSSDDATLNARVARLDGDAVARDEVQRHYETTGRLLVPLVTSHTTADPVVRYEQADLYADKITAMGQSDYYYHIPAQAYGHCTFTQFQLLAAMNRLINMDSNLPDFEPQIYMPLILKRN